MNELLQQQLNYYRARAAEYDEWWLRTGRYDNGPEANARWHAEGDKVRAALAAEIDRRPARILELAAGTGNWTVQLAAAGSPVTVVDGSQEMLAINQVKVGRENVRYVEADLFTWEPDGQYDLIVFGFWHSHVPPERLAAFWQTVERALAPGGRVFLIDSLPVQSSTSADQKVDTTNVMMKRRLNDGREYTIFKVYFTAPQLTERLAPLGLAGDLHHSGDYFLYGTVRAR